MSGNQLRLELERLTAENGFVTFYQYQNLALYHPEEGYYMKPRSPFGRAGDFYTAPAVHSIFGETVATYLAQFMQTDQERLSIIELGAGNGQLAQAILDFYKDHHSEIYNRLDYRILEVSPRSLQEQKSRLLAHTSVVSWVDKLPRLQYAIILNNEFWDALPTHWLQKSNSDTWMEVSGLFQNGDMRETLIPVTNPRLIQYAHKYGADLENTSRLEACLAYEFWLKEIRASFAEGYLLSFDYGAEADELYPTYLKEGTLRGFSRHQVISEVWSRPGEIDLTHDVNFTEIKSIGEELGMKTEFLLPQSSFLFQSGIFEHLQSSSEVLNPQRSAAIKHLLLGFPPKFQVLLQRL